MTRKKKKNERGFFKKIFYARLSRYLCRTGVFETRTSSPFWVQACNERTISGDLTTNRRDVLRIMTRIRNELERERRFRTGPKSRLACYRQLFVAISAARIRPEQLPCVSANVRFPSFTVKTSGAVFFCFYIFFARPRSRLVRKVRDDE